MTSSEITSNMTMTTVQEPPKPPLIFVIGCPGAGKGTLCCMLAKEYRGIHLSVGDLLRAKADQILNDIEPEDEQKRTLTEHEVLAKHIKGGTLVPSELLLDILKSTLDKYIHDGMPGFLLLDGFPRVLPQGQEAEKAIGKPDLVLFLNCGKEIAAKRFLARKLPGRLTDDMTMFEKRYTEFANLNEEIVEHYRESGKLVEVNTEAETEDSYERLTRALFERAEWIKMVRALVRAINQE